MRYCYSYYSIFNILNFLYQKQYIYDTKSNDVFWKDLNSQTSQITGFKLIPHFVCNIQNPVRHTDINKKQNKSILTKVKQ